MNALLARAERSSSSSSKMALGFPAATTHSSIGARARASAACARGAAEKEASASAHTRMVGRMGRAVFSAALAPSRVGSADLYTSERRFTVPAVLHT